MTTWLAEASIFPHGLDYVFNQTGWPIQVSSVVHVASVCVQAYVYMRICKCVCMRMCKRVCAWRGSRRRRVHKRNEGQLLTKVERVHSNNHPLPTTTPHTLQSGHH